MRKTNPYKPIKSQSSGSPIVMKAIQAGARGLHTVMIQYTDSHGTSTIRETEPYELKDGKYWAYDLDKQEIRQFTLGQIADAQVTVRTYRPRWPVKIF